MSERHNHGKNCSGKIRIQSFTKSFILRVYDVLARHRTWSTGTPEQTEEATKPMRSVGHALLDHVGPAPFPVVQSLFDGLYVSGLQSYWGGANIPRLSGEAHTIQILSRDKRTPTPL